MIKRTMHWSCIPSMVAIAILAGPAPAAASPSSPAPATSIAQAARTLTVLDPVDMGAMATSPHLGDRVRIILKEAGPWSPLERNEQDAKLREYNFDPAAPCKEFQCGFDAGSVLQSEFVLFGTVTDLGRMYSYTLNLLHMPSSQVVHSEVGEVAVKNGGDRAAALMGRIEGLLRAIDPARLSTAVRPKRGLMAVLDLSDSSPHSRTMAERVTTHAYASRHFDLISQVELEELLTALELQKSVLGGSEEALLGLGEKLGVSHLVVSRLSQEGNPRAPDWKMHLSLYDIGERRRLREWPASSSDFRKLLHFENRFFSTLAGEDLAPEWAAAPPAPRRSYGWKIVLSGLGMAAGGAMGYLAYEESRKAEREYNRTESALSSDAVESHRERTERLDDRTKVFGGLAALGFGLSLTVWAF